MKGQSKIEIRKDIIIADSLLHSAEYDLALITYQKTLDQIENEPWHSEIVMCRNQISDILIIKSKFSEALSILQDNLAYGQQNLEKQDILIADIHHYLGIALMKIGKLDEALDRHSTSLQIKIAANSDSISLARSYLQIGHTYLYKNNETPAYENLQQALKYSKNSKPSHIVLARTYRHLGNYYYGLMDYNLSLEYNLKAVEILKNVCSDKDILFATTYGNIAELYAKMGNLDNAKAYSEKSLQVSILNKANQSIALSLTNLALLYEKNTKYKKALETYKKALDYFIIIFPSKDHVRIANTYQYLGNVYLKLGNNKEAKKEFEKALMIRENDYLKGNGNYLYLIELYNGLGKVHEQQKDFNKSLELYQKAFEIGQNKTLKISSNPLFQIATYNNIARAKLNLQEHTSAIKDVSNAIDINTSNGESNYNNLQLLDSYIIQLQIMRSLWLSRSDQSYLDRCYNILSTCDSLIYSIRIGYKDEFDRISFNQKAHQYFEIGIDVLFQLYTQTNKAEYINDAFSLMERSRANSLYLGIQENEALKYGTIPDSVIIFEKQLKQNIASIEKNVYHKYTLQGNNELTELQNKLFNLKSQYRLFIQNLEAEHPKYFELKYESQKYEARDIQNNLNNFEAIISYLVTEKSIFSINMTKDNLKLFKIKKPENWQLLISKFRDLISNTQNIGNELNYNENLDSFILSSTQLYNTLMEPHLGITQKKISKLYIIPDEKLCFLPFEILIPEEQIQKKDYKKLPYLIKDYTIGYSYSARIFGSQEKNESQKSTKPYGGFAPSYTVNNNLIIISDNIDSENRIASNLKNLPAIQNEIQYNAKILNGDFFISEYGSKEAFIANAHKYQILHLGMHAIVNNDNPLRSTLIFGNQKNKPYDNLLDIGDIYNLNISADLTILSACNTAYGRLYKGEGPISLNRAFRYAGCPNMITSLWQVPDIQTAQITSTFLKELKSGSLKEESLRNAKLSYLEDCPISKAHPIYWAGFISSGNNKPIKMQTDSNRMYIMSPLFLFILIFGWLGYKKIK